MTATGRYILFYDGEARLKYRSEAVKLLIENLKPDGLMYMLLKIAPPGCFRLYLQHNSQVKEFSTGNCLPNLLF